MRPTVRILVLQLVCFNHLWKGQHMRHPGKASASRAGRPLLPKDELRSEIIRMRATKAEKGNYDKRGGNTWLRQQLTKTDKQT